MSLVEQFFKKRLKCSPKEGLVRGLMVASLATSLLVPAAAFANEPAKKPQPAAVSQSAGANKAEPAKAEPAKAEPAKAEPAKAEPSRSEPSRAEPAKAEAPKPAPKEEPKAAEPKQSDVKASEAKSQSEPAKPAGNAGNTGNAASAGDAKKADQPGSSEKAQPKAEAAKADDRGNGRANGSSGGDNVYQDGAPLKGNPSDEKFRCSPMPENTGRGANTDGSYNNTCEREHEPGNGSERGKATGQPCAGCVGKADDKNPPGQWPDGSDHNAGYECDRNQGVGKENPAHTGCRPSTTPPPAPTPCPDGSMPDSSKPGNPCKKDNGNNGGGNNGGGNNGKTKVNLEGCYTENATGKLEWIKKHEIEESERDEFLKSHTLNPDMKNPADCRKAGDLPKDDDDDKGKVWICHVLPEAASHDYNLLHISLQGWLNGHDKHEHDVFFGENKPTDEQLREKCGAPAKNAPVEKAYAACFLNTVDKKYYMVNIKYFTQAELNEKLNIVLRDHVATNMNPADCVNRDTTPANNSGSNNSSNNTSTNTETRTETRNEERVQTVSLPSVAPVEAPAPSAVASVVDEMPSAPAPAIVDAPAAPEAPAPVLVTSVAEAVPAPVGSIEIAPAPEGVQGVQDLASPFASLIPSTGQQLVDLGIIALGLTVLGLGGLGAVRYGLKRR